MNKIVLILGVVSSIIVTIFGLCYDQFLTVILSVLTSIIAASVFYYFQIYLPNQKSMKKAKRIFTSKMQKMIKEVEEKHFFLVDIMDGEDIFIESKLKFYKYSLDSGNYVYSYFNYQDDLSILNHKYKKLVDTYGEYCMRYGTEKEEESYLNMKFIDSIEYLTVLFNSSTEPSIYPIRFGMKDYKENIAIYEKNLKLIADFINYNLNLKSYDKLDDLEIKDYIMKMQNQITQQRYKISIPYIYSGKISPLVYLNNGWYRVLDPSDYFNSQKESLKSVP